ncbi:hypothetical protein ABT147_25315 [Streptomyces sp. NPDC001868]|uniref:hypothetical protein n=1 Tax=Streptomyces sp. NPDC001868 TaxID=3154401 RepID=UPI003320AC04
MNHGPEEQGPHPKGRHLEGRAPDDSGSEDPPSDEVGSKDLPSDDVDSGDLPSENPPSGDLSSDDSRSADLNSADPGAADSGADEPGADRSDAGASDVDRSATGSSGTAGPDVDVPRFGALRSAGPRSGLNGSGPNGSVPKGIGGSEPDDELVLRNLLLQAVSDIEPRDGTLEHLRRAVPARRARKRQAVVGMAAAALFIGTAIPALVHVSNSAGSDVNPSIMGNGSQTQGSAETKGQTGGGRASGGSSGGSKESGKDSGKDKDDKGKGEHNGTTGGAQATPTTAASTLCTAGQLGGGGSVGAPDSGGAVYGTFRVSNISGTSCTVTGAGSVSAIPQGAADASKITVATHVAGDAATGLPDPSLSLAQLVLAPGSAYEVQFAWVPSEPCPTSTDGGTTDGGTGGTDPTTDPTPTGEATPGTTTDGSNSVSTQLFTEDGVADGSVLVAHTTEGGIATFSTTVANACAGVVYQTGLLAGA